MRCLASVWRAYLPEGRGQPCRRMSPVGVRAQSRCSRLAAAAAAAVCLHHQSLPELACGSVQQSVEGAWARNVAGSR